MMDGDGEEEEEEEALTFLLHAAASSGDLEELRRLVDEEGEDVNKLTAASESPLMFASLRGRLEAVRFLLDRGADIDLRSGGPPLPALWWACCRGHVEVARLLLERGADPTTTDSTGATVLITIAMCCPRGDEEAFVAITRLLLTDGRVDVNARNKDGGTALCHACLKGNVDMARVLLLEGGAAHKVGCTPSACARFKGHEDCVQLLKWFDGEVERCYCLAKAWHVNDNREAIRQAPTKAEARTVEEAQLAREEAAAQYARGRVERGEELPRLGVVRDAHYDGGGDSGKKRGREEERGEVVRAVFRHVVMGMKEDPFLALMDLMRLR